MNHRFLRACRREWTDRVPVWFMRQAGRYMEEYRAVRAKHSILEVCKTPELAAQVTLQPIERFPIDAAIIFADILIIRVRLDFRREEDSISPEAAGSCGLHSPPCSEKLHAEAPY